MRRDMIAESRQAWTKFDEEMKKLETQSFAKSLNIETSIGEANNPTPSPPPPPAPKEEIKEEKKETNLVQQHENKHLVEDIRPSLFTPMKLVRFPSLFGDEKKEKSSMFKEENVIKVIFL